VAAGDAAGFFAGENKDVLLIGEDPSLEGVAGFLGDLVGSFGTGDLTGEQSKSSSCWDVTLRGDLDGNKAEVACKSLTGVIVGLESFTGVLMDLTGDEKRFEAALFVTEVEEEVFVALGEHSKSSNWFESNCLGDFVGNRAFVGVGFNDLLTGVRDLFIGVLDFSGLFRRLRTSSLVNFGGLLNKSAFEALLTSFVDFFADKFVFGLERASLESPEHGLSPTGTFSLRSFICLSGVLVCFEGET